MIRIAVAASVLALVVSATPAFPDGQEEQFTPEFKAVHTTVDPKHTPKIEAPASVKRGEWFDITVSVAHPSLAEHFVRSTALFCLSASTVSFSQWWRSGNLDRRLYGGLCAAISRNSRTSASSACAHSITSTRCAAASISEIRARFSAAVK